MCRILNETLSKEPLISTTIFQRRVSLHVSTHSFDMLRGTLVTESKGSLDFGGV